MSVNEQKADIERLIKDVSFVPPTEACDISEHPALLPTVVVNKWLNVTDVMIRICAVIAFAFWALTSAAVAATQSVAGVEIEYSLPLQRQPDTEKRVLESTKERVGPAVHSLEVYTAALTWDIGDGQGYVQVVRIEFASARKIDDALREMGSLVLNYGGQVFKHTVTKLSVSTLDARQMAFEREVSGLRLGGELLVVSDARGHTMWQVQVLFGRRPLSVNLDQDRQLAQRVLASVRVVEASRAKSPRPDLAAQPPNQPSAGCTLWESEEKMREVTYGIGDIQARDTEKGDRINSRFMEAFDRYLEPTSSPQQAELARNAFCRTLDELLLEMR